MGSFSMMEEENDTENTFGMAILFYFFFNQEFSGSLVVSKKHLKIK
jgi:hypothetical protein